jgi:calcineurin-like phosphoesterase family protein
MNNRPFENIAEMNEALIANWNAVVRKDDDVYILGDFLYKGTAIQANKILKQLKGKKYLIKGNHDEYLDDNDFDVSAFEWVKEYHALSYGDTRFVLFHYPILEWQFYRKKSIHLYGHVHNNVGRIPEDVARFACLGNRAFNVGVDVNNFYPVSAKEILKRAFGDSIS